VCDMPAQTSDAALYSADEIFKEGARGDA